MNPMPQLAPTLRQLRLSGVLDSLETRTKQAVADQISHIDFLAMLLQDEVARREQKKLATRIRRGNFRPDKTLETYDFAFNPLMNRAMIQDLATCRFIEERAPVVIVGPCGTGKSHIAQALANLAARKGYDVLFTNQTRLFGTLQEARLTNTFDRKLAMLAKLDLLIIDDFGIKPLRNPQDEDLHELIAERYERKSTIITSNLDLPEWSQALPNKLLGAATIDRIKHGAYILTLEGESYRTARPPQERKASKKAGAKEAE
ncbi:MAG TPA: IS21-like element helper ATPase IstB [Candidatus Ozemobacteraceae bacterium]|nr:IS21-like element helper ATPase IstB [Candidatus Ozemobacteraceae bacterium]